MIVRRTSRGAWAPPFFGSLALLGLAGIAACGGSSSNTKNEPRYNIVRPEERPPEMSGLPPDKEQEVQLLLAQRDVSTRKCYQDVLNEKKDRNFEGSVRVLISIGTNGAATAVKPMGGTLNDKEVETCLVSTLKSFEYPELTQPGDVQYEFRFRPAY
jgi:hypothetical protein